MLKITKIKPMFTSIVTTMDKYTEDVKHTAGIIDGSKTAGTLKEYQTVVEVGPNARVQVGDKIMINPARYANVQHKHRKNSLGQLEKDDITSITYNFDVININGVDHLLLQDSDVMYVFEGEEVPDEQKSNLILPENKKIII